MHLVVMLRNSGSILLTCYLVLLVLVTDQEEWVSVSKSSWMDC